jgi:cytohesin
VSRQLAQAAAAGDLPAVRELLEAAPDGARHWQPLMNAAFGGHAAIVRELLDQGADPNMLARNGRRHRPLHRCLEPKRTIAKHAGHLEVVRLLAGHGADLDVPAGPQDWTPLQLAAFGGLRAAVDLLRELGAKVDLHGAAMLYNAAEVGRRLRADPAVVAAPDGAGRSPLHALAASGMWRATTGGSRDAIAVAAALLEAGAAIDAVQPIPDGAGTFPATPLWWAAVWQDHVALCRYLLGRGASPEGCMWGVAYNGNLALLELLRAHGGALDPRSAEGRTPLHDLLLLRRPKAVGWLLEHGADPDARDRSGRTALHLAAAAGAGRRVIEQLLAHGARIDARDEAGRTPLDLARVNGQDKVIEILRERGDQAGA